MKRYVSSSEANKVYVYAVTINYQGEITDKEEVARFKNMRWAEEFIEVCREWTNKEGGYRFLVKNGTSEELI